MRTWMLKGSLEDFNATWEYCRFATVQERAPIFPGDKIVCFCNGLIMGVFEAEKIVEREFGP